MRATIGSFAAAAAVIGTATASASAQQAVQWRVEDGGNGHWYHGVIQDGVTWSQARAAAIAMGADLASLSTSLECDYVYSTVINRPALWNNRIGPWIGLTQLPGSIEPAGGWQWVDGTPLEDARWLAGHPSHHSPGMPARDFAIYSAWPTSPANTWADDGDFSPSPYHWESFRSFVVEWSADCNNDGIVDYGQILDGTLFDGDLNGVPDCCELDYDCTQNLLQNGSFESGPAQADCTWTMVAPGSTAIAPWQVIAANVDRQRISATCGQTESWRSYLGEYTVDLDGDTHGGAISQVIPTVAGAEYRLTLQLTANCGAFTQKRIRVRAGNVESEFSVNCQAGYPQPWKPFAMSFMANSSSTTVEIRSLSAAFRNGPVIDDVRVSRIGGSPDCNADGIPDAEQILSGQLVDANNNGIPDSCEVDPCPADTNNSGAVNGVDLAIVLGAWGTSGQGDGDADINNDGIVNGVDLAMVLAGWGPCP